MHLYVTDRIKYYHKVGIAEQLSERMNGYRTLVPDLECTYDIDLPKKIAKSMENLIRGALSGYSVIRNHKRTECYNLKLKYIKKTILNASAVLEYPLISIRFLNTTYGGSHTTWRADRNIFKRRINYNDYFFVYLDKLYFEKYIPLMTIEKISPKKVKMNLIDTLTLDKLVKKANWMKEDLEDFRLSNPLFDKLKNYEDFLLANTPMQKIITFLEKIIFKAIKDYVLEDEVLDKGRIPLLNRGCINRPRNMSLIAGSFKAGFEFINFDKAKKG